MNSVRLIRRRVRSSKNISQITRAMELVSASKMKKAQNLAVLGRPYAQKIMEATQALAEKTEREKHPLLKENKAGKILVVLISTNKGLCGALNTNLFRAVFNWFNKDDVDYLTLGRKGERFVVRTGKTLVADFSLNLPFVASVSAVSDFIVKSYLKEIYREVFLSYNNFVSILRQTPAKKRILPIEFTVFPEEGKFGSGLGEFIIEPSPKIILEALLPHYLEVEIRLAILEAEASEHSARMLAMKNATDNALELIKELTLEYNKARQQAITYEIADMVTARMAVE